MHADMYDGAHGEALRFTLHVLLNCTSGPVAFPEYSIARFDLEGRSRSYLLTRDHYTHLHQITPL